MFENYKGTKNANLRLFDTLLISLNISISFSNRLQLLSGFRFVKSQTSR